MRLTVKNIGKMFDQKAVLKDVSMRIDHGEIICLLGPSGAGKTTLIRLMIGAIKADSGEIFMDDIPLPNPRIAKEIGFMPQNDALYGDLSGWDNLLFFGGLYGMKPAALRKRSDELLELMDLTNDKRKPVKYYSGGMKKRLSLAVAMLHHPKLLLLDEPTVGIDPVLRRKIWELFFTLKRQGTTMIVSTHVMDEAMKCDKAALIYQGELIAFDTIPSLLAETPNGNIEEIFFIATGGVR